MVTHLWSNESETVDLYHSDAFFLSLLKKKVQFLYFLLNKKVLAKLKKKIIPGGCREVLRIEFLIFWHIKGFLFCFKQYFLEHIEQPWHRLHFALNYPARFPPPPLTTLIIVTTTRILVECLDLKGRPNNKTVSKRRGVRVASSGSAPLSGIRVKLRSRFSRSIVYSTPRILSELNILIVCRTKFIIPSRQVFLTYSVNKRAKPPFCRPFSLRRVITSLAVVVIRLLKS